jgi:hypothetical protein
MIFSCVPSVLIKSCWKAAWVDLLGWFAKDLNLVHKFKDQVQFPRFVDLSVIARFIIRQLLGHRVGYLGLFDFLTNNHLWPLLISPFNCVIMAWPLKRLRRSLFLGSHKSCWIKELKNFVCYLRYDPLFYIENIFFTEYHWPVLFLIIQFSDFFSPWNRMSGYNWQLVWVILLKVNPLTQQQWPAITTNNGLLLSKVI